MIIISPMTKKKYDIFFKYLGLFWFRKNQFFLLVSRKKSCCFVHSLFNLNSEILYYCPMEKKHFILNKCSKSLYKIHVNVVLYILEISDLQFQPLNSLIIILFLNFCVITSKLFKSECPFYEKILYPSKILDSSGPLI